jgi:hypothetical protein
MISSRNFNNLSKTQVEGRAIRYCSHVDIDETLHKPLRRIVVVDIYKSMPRPKGEVKETCDQVIYDTIIENKKQSGERALKKVAEICTKTKNSRRPPPRQTLDLHLSK